MCYFPYQGHISICQAAVGVIMSVEPLPEQEKAVVERVSINLPWQHWHDDFDPMVTKVNTM